MDSKSPKKIYHVVAMAENRVIGKNNKLPWHFSADLKHFKQLTLNQTVVMGRKTYESIGRPLPSRANFVLSRAHHADPGVSYFGSLQDAFANVATEKAYIIGGSTIYQQTLDDVDGVYLTLIHQAFEGDAYYPELPRHFEERSRMKLQEGPLIEILYLENTRKHAASR
ncbi:MAG TPA: dihydrofolate reductase [Verrucomicrobiae bacterium]|jgi:dihydrofolate reductase|nr:dihydrofolate reductase [Verrucomicrobiae bacterium]